MDEKKEKLAAYITRDMIGCAACHAASEELDIPLEEISGLLDELGCRIKGCQMGLFGHTIDEKQIDPDIEIPPAVIAALKTRQTDGRISCKACWDMADEFHIKRIHIGSACEKTGIRIKPCQLGIF